MRSTLFGRHKTLTTLLALMGLVATVRLGMDGQVTLLPERLPTNCAIKRLDLRVDELVRIQVILATEAARTDVTRIGLLT